MHPLHERLKVIALIVDIRHRRLSTIFRGDQRFRWSMVADVVAAALDNAKRLVSSSEFAERRKDAQRLKRRPKIVWIE